METSQMKLAIMNKSCGQFWETRAENGKLKSNLEWPIVYTLVHTNRRDPVKQVD